MRIGRLFAAKTEMMIIAGVEMFYGQGLGEDRCGTFVSFLELQSLKYAGVYCPVPDVCCHSGVGCATLNHM